MSILFTGTLLFLFSESLLQINDELNSCFTRHGRHMKNRQAVLNPSQSNNETVTSFSPLPEAPVSQGLLMNIQTPTVCMYMYRCTYSTCTCTCMYTRTVQLHCTCTCVQYSYMYSYACLTIACTCIHIYMYMCT